MAMFKNQSKRGSKQVRTDDPTGIRVPPERSPSPYSMFYPPETTEAISIMPEKLDQTKSAGFVVRSSQRTKKQQFCEEQTGVFQEYEQSNLVTLHKAFMQEVNEEGEIDRHGFKEALYSVGISETKESFLDGIYSLFSDEDPNAKEDKGMIDYKSVIQALHVIVNGSNALTTSKNCFTLFDPTQCGYIIEDQVREMKENRTEGEAISHQMVKAVLDIFDVLAPEYRMKWEKEWSKGKKGKGKGGKKGGKDEKGGKGKGKEKEKPAPEKKKGGEKEEPLPPAQGGIPKFLPNGNPVPPYDPLRPPRWEPKVHLSLAEFSEFFQREPRLVQAFVVPILSTIKEVYEKNRPAADASRQRAESREPALREAAAAVAAPSTASAPGTAASVSGGAGAGSASQHSPAPSATGSPHSSRPPTSHRG